MTPTTAKPRNASLRVEGGTNGVSRIYVNLGEENLGYLERRIETESRGISTYVDRHRIAKGDLDVMKSDMVTIVGLTDGLVEKVDDAVGFDPTRAIDDTGVDRWLRWLDKSQGIIYRNSRHKAEVKKFKVLLTV